MLFVSEKRETSRFLADNRTGGSGGVQSCAAKRALKTNNFPASACISSELRVSGGGMRDQCAALIH